MDVSDTVTSQTEHSEFPLTSRKRVAVESERNGERKVHTILWDGILKMI